MVLTAISSVLCKLQPDLFPTAAVFSLLQTSPDFAQIRSHATQSLLSVFGDATAIATSPSLLCQMLLLPHAAMCELLKSDSLTTDAEATVLVLLCEWCGGALGMTCTLCQHEQLHGCIRYSRVSNPYLTDLCEVIPMLHLSTRQRMELLYFRSLPHNIQERPGGISPLHNPRSWYLPERPMTSPHANLLELTLRVSVAELSRFFQHGKLSQDQNEEAFLKSCPVYAHGFWWTLIIQISHQQLPWCGVYAHGVQSLLNADDWWFLSHCIMCDVHMTILGMAGMNFPYVPRMHLKPVNSKGFGCDFVNRDGQATMSQHDENWWRQHVVDGFFTLIASIAIHS